MRSLVIPMNDVVATLLTSMPGYDLQSQAMAT